MRKTPKLKVFIVSVFGMHRSIHRTKKEAIATGNEILEPTGDDGDNYIFDFSVEEYQEGRDLANNSNHYFEFSYTMTHAEWEKACEAKHSR